MSLHCCLAVLAAAQISVGFAASPAIGVVTARGGIRLDQASLAGSGTLFEGTTVETLRSAGDLRLTNGVRLLLASGSKARIYRDRLVLERGEGRLTAAGREPFHVETGSLRVSGGEGGGLAKVQVDSESRALVAAVRGTLSVATTSGIPLASIAAGKALTLDAQGVGANGPTMLTGYVFEKGGRYFLTDEAAGITVELRGSTIKKLVGSRIQVTGEHIPVGPDGTDAVQIIAVKVLDGDAEAVAAAQAINAASSAPGAGAAGGAAAAGAAGAGLGGATTAVIAGVVVAAAATGTVLAVAGPDEPDPISR